MPRHRGGNDGKTFQDNDADKAKTQPGDYMVNVGKNALARQQDDMGYEARRTEAGYEDIAAHKAARQSKVAKEYKGVAGK